MNLLRQVGSPSCLSALAVVALCLTSRLSQSTRAADAAAGTTPVVAATVNGAPIYEQQLQTEVEKELASFRRYGMRKDRPDLVRQLRDQALDKIIGDQLIFQESQKLTIDNLEEKIAQQLASFEENRGGKQGLEKYMKQRALTPEKLKESAKVRVHVNEYLQQQGIAEPEIPEERIRQMYDANPDSYAREESVRVSHILLAVDPQASPEAKQQARQQAEQIRQDILDGKDFSEMAKAHSDCNSAAGGGDLRYIRKGYMPQEFDQVAFTIDKDALSEVVETKFGYHILKVTDRVPAGVAPYDEVRDFIKKYLQMEESKIKLAAHITQLRAKAQIKILPQ